MLTDHEIEPELVVSEGYYRVPTSSKAGTVITLVDAADFALLAGRGLSLGSHGYVQMADDQRMHLLHRWLFGLSGKGRHLVVDHRSRDHLDNRRRNLRVVDPSVSNANRSIAERPGVGTYQVPSGRWQAKFRWRRTAHYVGTFDTQDVAAQTLLAYRQFHCPDSIPPERTT